MVSERPSLQDDLDKLERENPKVRAAAERYGHAVWRLAFKRRIEKRRKG